MDAAFPHVPETDLPMHEQPEKPVRPNEPLIKSPLLGWVVLSVMVAAVFAIAAFFTGG